MTDFNPFEDTGEPEDVAPAEETPRKRGRPKKEGNPPSDGRQGSKHIGGNFPLPVSTELQRVCVEIEEKTGRKCSIQSLLAKGINHVLRQAGRQGIAKED